jgi:mRNA interferase RelE/StbE
MKIVFTKSSVKELKDIETIFSKRIYNRILLLADEPFPFGFKKLQGTEGYRIRIGDYRVVYTVDDRLKLITVVKIGHRRDIYR